ncbi:hypothetical protein [Streptomyces griseoluteus]
MALVSAQATGTPGGDYAEAQAVAEAVRSLR